MGDSRNCVYRRRYVADRLWHLGFPALADQALRDLPDPVDVDDLQAWTMRHGVSKDDVISSMGGSP